MIQSLLVTKFKKLIENCFNGIQQLHIIDAFTNM